jgi:uridine kinase
MVVIVMSSPLLTADHASPATLAASSGYGPLPMTGRPFVLGVAGGTGSGKTTVAEHLAELMGAGTLALLRLDSYYSDRPDLTFEERTTLNYDHPDAFDWPLLLWQVTQLTNNQPVEIPTYDFNEFRRGEATEAVHPASIVVIEGILVLYEPALRDLMDLKVFVDTDPDVRFIRRLERDVAERGRTTESVIAQYLGTVRPMHLQFIEPTKRYADVIVPHGGRNEPALDVLLARIRELV